MLDSLSWHFKWLLWKNVRDRNDHCRKQYTSFAIVGSNICWWFTEMKKLIAFKNWKFKSYWRSFTQHTSRPIYVTFCLPCLFLGEKFLTESKEGISGDRWKCLRKSKHKTCAFERNKQSYHLWFLTSEFYEMKRIRKKTNIYKSVIFLLHLTEVNLDLIEKQLNVS